MLGLRAGNSQSNSFSPYSRYALGERPPQTFAHNQGMGGAFIAHKPDSAMPVFVNAGNPAAYALIRITALEVGGRYIYSDQQSNSSGLRKWGTNFSYGALGFPVGRKGGACLGIMPYSAVGYNTESRESEAVGEVTYRYTGSGGINKAFLGYGVMPFSQRLIRFRYRNLNVPDSIPHLKGSAFHWGHTFSKLLSDLSLGVNANYLFGNVQHAGRVIYPEGTLYNNTYWERSYYVGDFSGNAGIQTAFTFDSVRAEGGRRVLREKTKLTFGYFMTIGNSLKAYSNVSSFNFIYINGQELIRDTVAYDVEQRGQITLPVEHGIGIGFKKGERFNAVADVATTLWQGFTAPHHAGSLKNSLRISAGLSFVPEKFAAGRNAFWRKTNYRVGAGYEQGPIFLQNTSIDTYFISAGVGLPVGIGRLSSMINISLQAGTTGTTENGLLRENFFRAHFGFTFCDRWFQKFRYD